MGWLMFLNMFFIQWFFVRVARSGTRDKNFIFIQKSWIMIGFILPMTGWWNDYIYIGGYRDWHLKTLKYPKELKNL